MSSVGLSSSDLATLLGVSSSTSSSSKGIDLSSILQAATGSATKGLDITAAVNSAVTAARAPEVLWKAQQAAIQSQESDLNSLYTSVSTIEDDLSALNRFSGALSSLTTSSSDSSIATASTSLGAVAGTHVVNVTQLATTDAWYSSSPVGAAGLSAGSFNLQVGTGTVKPIIISSGETLAQLASDINGKSLGVTASVVSDSNGSRLSIVSNSSGTKNGIKITPQTPQVTQAADGSAWNSASVATNAGLSAGSFSIQVGTATKTPITITQGESVSALAAAINQANPGVTASELTDSTGFSHLQIVNKTGVPPDASGITITNPTPQFTQTATQLQDAMLTVDGVPFVSGSNKVTDVIPRVTINLNGADGSAIGTNVTISITPNTDAITTAINQFITDYNTVITAVNKEYTYDPSSSAAQPLAGDSTLRLLQDALLGAGSYSDSNNGSFSTLGAIGIAMNNDGTLSLDKSTLGDAIQSNSSAVQQFFVGTALDGFSQALSNQLQSLTAPSDGAFTVDLSSMQSNYSALQDTITNFEDNYISTLQTNLTAEFSAAEIALQNVTTLKQQINAMLGNNTSSS